MYVIVMQIYFDYNNSHKVSTPNLMLLCIFSVSLGTNFNLCKHESSNYHIIYDKCPAADCGDSIRNHECSPGTVWF